MSHEPRTGVLDMDELSLAAIARERDVAVLLTVVER